MMYNKNRHYGYWQKVARLEAMSKCLQSSFPIFLLWILDKIEPISKPCNGIFHKVSQIIPEVHLQ